MATEDEPLATAPLLRTFHERHPHVDLVVLPPVGTEPPQDPLGVAEAAAVAAASGTVFDDVIEASGQSPEVRTEIWAPGRSVGWHRLVLRTSLRGLVAEGEAAHLLSVVASHLGVTGWSRVEGSSADLAVIKGIMRLEVDAFPESLDLCLSTEPVPVSAQVLAELRASA